MNRGLLHLPLTALLGACASTMAAKAPPVQADWMTVSGRHALPKAGGSPLAGRLRVGEVVITPMAAQQMSLDPELYRATLRDAVEKSLGNYGWLGSGADAVPITVEAMALTIEAQEKDTVVAAPLRIRPTGAASACLSRDARAEFKALAPTKSGGGQRAFGWVAGIALAALSGPTGAASIGTWIAQNDQAAAAQNAALNARRKTAYGEGVAPSFNKSVQARYAGVNATQLAIADYLAHLASACARS